MGGRGASSGISHKGNEYGSQYDTILQSGNIKFITKNARDSESLMETMTSGRVYVTVGGNDLISITYFDKTNKRNKVIHLNHEHKKIIPHVHHGYFHKENETSKKGASNLTKEEKIMVERAKNIWYNYINK